LLDRVAAAHPDAQDSPAAGGMMMLCQPKGVRPVTEKIPHGKLQFARAVVGLMAAFVLGGILWYGMAPDQLARVWQNLVDRPGGPMVFRYFLQPTMASVAAILSGIKDARLGRTPFLHAVLTNPAERAGRLDEAIVDTSRLLLLGLIIDSVYQFVEFDSFHPGEAVIITLLLAFLPYLLLRGLVARVARRWIGPGNAKGA
jgi:hypothetical protein